MQGGISRRALARNPLIHLAMALGLVLGLGAVRASAVEPAAGGTAAGSPVGNWLTEGGHGVIEIAQCGPALCGRIVGIDRSPNEPMPTDVDGRSQCGLPIIADARPTADGAWVGKITDPRNGATYQARLWVDTDGRLHLRGFLLVPLLGQTQVWQRFDGQLNATCELT